MSSLADRLDDVELSEAPIVVLDTETTGLEAGLGHRIVEIGAIRYEGGRVVAEVEQLLNPQRPMSERATDITGITDADLEGQPRFADIRAQLDEILDGAVIIAHNAAFDADFLGFEYAHNEPQAEPNKLLLPNPWICTLLLAKKHFHFGRNSLANIAAKLRIPQAKAHRALNDVVTTAEVFFRLAKELEKRHKYTTVGDLIFAQGNPIFATPPQEVILPELLDEAVKKQLDLQLTYISPKKGITERRFTPHYATLHKGEPYIVGYCHLRQELRAFKIDRIMGAEFVSG